jgi:hypothetical protein
MDKDKIVSRTILVNMQEELYGKMVHIWTDEEIQNLPCTENWFYGLVLQEDGHVVLSEIYPSIGRSDFELFKEADDDRSDEEFLTEIFSWIGSDILHWSPKSLIEAHPDAKKVDREKEAEDANSFGSIDELRKHLVEMDEDMYQSD